MKKIREYTPYLIILIIVILIRSFVITPVIVDGGSMSETLKDGNIVFLKKYDKNYKRYDIVVASYNSDRIIKRVIGLPREKIKCENGVVYINNQKITENYINNTTSDFSEIIVPDDNYFVMGDNRKSSLDSRFIGTIHKDDIKGTVNFVLFPFKKFGKIK